MSVTLVSRWTTPNVEASTTMARRANAEAQQIQQDNAKLGRSCMSD